MTSIELQITFDCHDPGAQALFWAEALGYRVQPPPHGFETWAAALDAWRVPPADRNDRSAVVPREGETGPRVFFQRVPEVKTVKNRLHLDLRSAPGLEGDERMEALETECVRLQELGAARIGRVEPDGIDSGWIVMADPEGNEFCLD